MSIPQSCPLINKAIRELDEIKSYAKQLCEDCKDNYKRDIISGCDDAENYMEQVREINSDLREEAEKFENEADSYRNDIDTLNEKISDLQSDLTYYKELNDELMSLKIVRLRYFFCDTYYKVKPVVVKYYRMFTKFEFPESLTRS